MGFCDCVSETMDGVVRDWAQGGALHDSNHKNTPLALPSKLYLHFSESINCFVIVCLAFA